MVRLVLGFLLLVASETQRPGAEEIAPVESIEGTTWTGTQFDTGDSLVLTFEKNHVLKYTTKYGTFTTASWKQAGAAIYFETNNKYAEYHGTIDGGRMSGKAGNVKNLRWTWKATRE
jgi:hypothetical protein